MSDTAHGKPIAFRLGYYTGVLLNELALRLMVLGLVGLFILGAAFVGSDVVKTLNTFDAVTARAPGITVTMKEAEGRIVCLRPDSFIDGVALAFAIGRGPVKFADGSFYKVHERYERVEGKPYACADRSRDAYRIEKIEPPAATSGENQGG